MVFSDVVSAHQKLMRIRRAPQANVRLPGAHRYLHEEQKTIRRSSLLREPRPSPSGALGSSGSKMVATCSSLKLSQEMATNVPTRSKDQRLGLVAAAIGRAQDCWKSFSLMDKTDRLDFSCDRITRHVLPDL